MSAGTVLVVDDDASIRLLCRVNLELEGYRVLDAARIEDARALVESERVDVALLDVHVGAESGLDLLRELKAKQPQVATALVTGTFDLESAARTDADAILGKPFSLDDLLATVRELRRMRDTA